MDPREVGLPKWVRQIIDDLRQRRLVNKGRPVITRKSVAESKKELGKRNENVTAMDVLGYLRPDTIGQDGMSQRHYRRTVSLM